MSTEKPTVPPVGNDGKPGLVGQNLKRIMGEQQVGIRELARRIGRPASTVNEILKGGTGEPRVDTQQLLARALGVDPDDLTLTKGELVEFELLLSAFEKSEASRGLVPPYGPDDEARLRAGRAAVVRKRLPPRGIRHLVRALRAGAKETDHQE